MGLALSAAGGPLTDARGRLSRDEFTARLESARRGLWLIAAGVLGRREGAEDCVQEAAMIGLQKIADFDPGTSFPAWMGGIVRNVARNHARKTYRRHTAPTDPVSIDRGTAASGPGPQSPGFDRAGRLAPDQGAFDDRVLAALNSLEEAARACLLLRIVHDMPYREISVWLGIPEGTAMSHVHRARQSLRRHLAAPGE